ncbi:MAG: DNA replication and repair protein RecF [Candidatus Daviesbacteria bacterium]
MDIKNLKFSNFRNFSQADLIFAQTVLLIGSNAQGKSNLLEAIYFLATTKSPRAEKDIQLIKEGEDFARVEGEIQQGEALTPQGLPLEKLEIFMQKKEGMEGLEKKLKVNGVGRRASDYIGNLVAVHFSPEDINLVTGPPALRRWHVDLTLAQIDKEYKNALNTYHSALTSRNRVLKGIKEGFSKINELDFWTDQLVSSGEIISQKRQDFFQFLNNLEFDDELGQFRFFYLENQFTQDLAREYLAREIAAAVTLIGPQRDDFIFKLDNRDLAYFGSRGEQRSAVLQLKLSELKFITQTKNILPILLLDDIFSELDRSHREHVIKIISGQPFDPSTLRQSSGLRAQGMQTILSAVETENIPKSFLQKVQIIRVEKGKIE